MNAANISLTEIDVDLEMKYAILCNKRIKESNHLKDIMEFTFNKTQLNKIIEKFIDIHNDFNEDTLVDKADSVYAYVNKVAYNIFHMYATDYSKQSEVKANTKVANLKNNIIYELENTFKNAKTGKEKQFHKAILKVPLKIRRCDDLVDVYSLQYTFRFFYE